MTLKVIKGGGFGALSCRESKALVRNTELYENY